MAKRLTINEIAKIARVSKGTVSKILNNKPGIGADTRRRVMELVNHLDYIPNSSAQALAFNRTMNIGLVVPHVAAASLNGSYWSSLVTAIVQRAARDRYHLMLFTPQAEGHLEEVYDSVLRSRKVDGLIIGAELIDKRSISRMLLTDLPFVLVGQNEDFQHYSVDVDNRSAAAAMTRYMLAHGFQRPAYLSGPLGYLYNRERLLGYQEAMQEAGLLAFSASAAEYTRSFVFREVDKMLKDAPNTDSIFVGAGGDFLFDVLSRLRDHGVDPHNLGLAVFDDYRFLDYMDPKITAVSQPIDRIGAEATQMLLDLIDKKSPIRPRVVLQTSIHARGSCRD